MKTLRLLLPLLALAAAGPAWAADPDAPIATAKAEAPPAAPADPVVQQIQTWVRAGPPAQEAAPEQAKARPFHGQVTAGVGTGGYREASVEAQGKVGGADVAIAISKVEGRGARWR